MNYLPFILTRNEAKKAILMSIDFVQSICAIKDNNILRRLESVSLIDNDKDYLESVYSIKS